MKPEKVFDYSLVPLLDLICQTINDTSFDSNYEKYIKESGGEPIFPSIPVNAVPLATPDNIRFVKEVLQEKRVIYIASGYVEENEGDYFFEAIRPIGYKEWYKYYQNAQFLKFNRWSVQQLYIFKSALELIEENPDEEYSNSARISENALPVDVSNLIKLSESESLSEFRRNTIASFDTFLKEGLIAGISKEEVEKEYGDPEQFIKLRFAPFVLDRFKLGLENAIIEKENALKFGNKPSVQSKIVLSIRYSPHREVLLNDTYLMATANLDGENDLVFNYLYSNPNKKFTRKELEEGIKQKITKDLDKIVENLGFRKDLRRIFFEVSKDAILFRNPITGDDLKNMGIDYIKI